MKGGGWWWGLSCLLFGDGSMGAKRYLFFLVFLQFLVCARQDDGGVMVFLGGSRGGRGPLRCTLPT